METRDASAHLHVHAHAHAHAERCAAAQISGAPLKYNSDARDAVRPSRAMARSSDAQLLFGGAIRAVTSGQGWSAWTPLDPPMPAEHPTGGTCEHGRYATLRLNSWPGQVRLPRQPMCLPANDRISSAINKRGHWYDCHQFVRLWNSAEREPSCRGSEGVLIEVGANIGACTVELLLRTRARIIAFEPSPTNLFYLTRSIRLAAQLHPEISTRVVVFPIGAGNVPLEHAQLYTERGNLGNTVVGTRHADACNTLDQACLRRVTRAAQTTTILPLDNVFPEGLGCARLMKLDVQGFECKVMAGAKRVLRTSRLRAVVAEVTPAALSAQCCSAAYLKEQLQVQPDWNVSCTSHEVCLGRGPGAKAMPRLWGEKAVDAGLQGLRWGRARAHGFGKFECTPPWSNNRSSRRRVANVPLRRRRN